MDISGGLHFYQYFEETNTHHDITYICSTISVWREMYRTTPTDLEHYKVKTNLNTRY